MSFSKTETRTENRPSLRLLKEVINEASAEKTPEA
jgi:hypothetical protein